jgi:hypothetical protein
MHNPRVDTKPSPPPVEALTATDPPKLPKPARGTDHPQPRAARPPPPPPPRRPSIPSGSVSPTSPKALPQAAIPPQRSAKLPYIRHEIVAQVDERSHIPGKFARATAEFAGPPVHLPRTDSAQLPDVDLDLDRALGAPPPPTRSSVRGTPVRDIAPGEEQIRTMVYAPEATRAAWIERELTHPSVTIQVGRRVRTIVTALLLDPPPRPQVLIIDFDAVSSAELLELHEIRSEGWFGRLIGLGHVPPELRTSLGIDHVFEPPLVRDSLRDCVAGTRHAAVTTACPVIPGWNDHS